MSRKWMATVNQRDLNRLLNKLKPEQLDPPLRDMFTRAGEEYLNRAKLRSPVDEGTLRSSLARGANEGIFDVDGHRPPRYVKVGTSHVDERSSFPYPVVLDTRDRFHYRGGGALGLAGQKTKGWFTGIRSTFGDVMNRLMGIAAREIKRRWDV